MNLKLNMKEINKILAKTHLKYNFSLNDAKKQQIFAETCLYEAVGNLPVMPSLLPPVLCVVSPEIAQCFFFWQTKTLVYSVEQLDRWFDGA